MYTSHSIRRILRWGNRGKGWHGLSACFGGLILDGAGPNPVLWRVSCPFGHYGRIFSSKESILGVFEFVIVLVLISTIGKVVSTRRSHALPGPATTGAPGEPGGLREIVDDLSSRLDRIEEERDFYKALLDSPERPRSIRPPTDDSGGPAA